MKKYLFLCIITLLVISGCVDKIQTQIKAETMGWDQAKYEDYSKYYDKVRPPYTNAQTLVFDIKDKLLDMHSDGSEFERTWYLAFSNLQNGLELRARADDFVCLPGDKGSISENNLDVAAINACSKRKTLLQESGVYFQKAFEYRKKVEEMKPK